MNRIIKHTVSILCGLVVVSCNLNNHPSFNDSDAFVSFNKATVSANETAGTIKVAVTLASVSGISTTISYEAVDGSAKAGTNYRLVDPTGTLTFSDTARTQYIQVAIIPMVGTYTGDLNFTLKFKSTGDVKQGAESTCEITIVDTDHPLNFILHEYTATGKSYFNGASTWDVKLFKDASDVNVVWIAGIIPYFAFETGSFGYPNYETRFYGNVNEDKTKILIPIPQACEYKYQGSYDITLYGLGEDLEVFESGSIEVEIAPDGSTLTFKEMGVYAADETGAWDAIYPGIVMTKKK